MAWLIDPEVCTNEIVDVPHMDAQLRFNHLGDLGKMLRVHNCKAEPVWEIFFNRIKR